MTELKAFEFVFACSCFSIAKFWCDQGKIANGVCWGLTGIGWILWTFGVLH